MSAILYKTTAELPQRIPPPISAMVRRCLEKVPGRRHNTAQKLLDNLLALRNP